jgi:ubiquinone/menaquinone biosynthesis C-methylase UbiE
MSVADVPSDSSVLSNDEGEEETPEPAHNEDAPDYGAAKYWDERYAHSPESFDWYEHWDTLLKVLGTLFDGSEIVLNVGCGNSMMAAEMRVTFDAVVNIDISSVVIGQMSKRFDGVDSLMWFTMDCTELKFDDGVFDLVFDKGTIDALMCGDGSIRKVGLTLWEIYRVLRPGGLFIEITYGRPDMRVTQFENYDIDWHLHEPLVIRNPVKGNLHWIYIFEKTPRDQESKITVPVTDIPPEDDEADG